MIIYKEKGRKLYTIINMGNVFDEIIELEELDGLISWNNKLVIGLQLVLIQELKTYKNFNEYYRFEVISFGFQGYYPVIGVVYLRDSVKPIEQFVHYYFSNLIQTKSISEIVPVIIQNKGIIKQVLDDIDGDNMSL